MQLTQCALPPNSVHVGMHRLMVTVIQVQSCLSLGRGLPKAHDARPHVSLRGRQVLNRARSAPSIVQPPTHWESCPFPDCLAHAIRLLIMLLSHLMPHASLGQGRHMYLWVARCRCELWPARASPAGPPGWPRTCQWTDWVTSAALEDESEQLSWCSADLHGRGRPSHEPTV